MSTLNIDENQFDEIVLKATGPVLVACHTDWSGPCLLIAPVLDEIASEMQDRIVIAKVNIDENPSIQWKYGVRSIPAMIIFKDGQPLATKVGSLSKSKLTEWITSVI